MKAAIDNMSMNRIRLFSNKTLSPKKQASGHSGPGLIVSDPESLSLSFLRPLCSLLYSSSDLLNISLTAFISFVFMRSVFVSAFRACTYAADGWFGGSLSEEWAHDELWASPLSVQDKSQSDRTRWWLYGFLSALECFRNLDALFSAFVTPGETLEPIDQWPSV